MKRPHHEPHLVLLWMFNFKLLITVSDEYRRLHIKVGIFSFTEQIMCHFVQMYKYKNK